MRAIYIPAVVYNIKSQPGDGTRYGFSVQHSEHDECWYCSAYESFLDYPKYIPDPNLINTGKGDVMDIAADSGCNPWTVAEVIRAIREIMSLEGIDIDGFELSY